MYLNYNVNLPPCTNLFICFFCFSQNLSHIQTDTRRYGKIYPNFDKSNQSSDVHSDDVTSGTMSMSVDRVTEKPTSERQVSSQFFATF